MLAVERKPTVREVTVKVEYSIIFTVDLLTLAALPGNGGAVHALTLPTAAEAAAI